MKKKYIIGTILILLTMSVLFIVSYSWFEGELKDKTVTSNEVKITTSKDLILSYKGSTYSSLNISDIINENFEFAQVTTTGLYNSNVYKIDYVKELDGLPAEYTNATANVDYLEFTVKLTSQQNRKRVYIDSVNSGFQNASPDSFFTSGNYTGIRPADCMRCSLSYQDSNTSSNRTIVFGNNQIGTNTNYNADGTLNTETPIINSFMYAKTLSEKDTYSYVLTEALNRKSDYSYLYYKGVKQTNARIKGTTTEDQNYCHLTGDQIVTHFTDYDFGAVNESNVAYENGILFDLEPYQEKNITIRIWLEGAAIPDTETSNTYIAGQGITFALRFSSTEDFNVLCNTKYISNEENYNSFNVSDAVNTYLGTNHGASFTSAVFDRNSENYKLKSTPTDTVSSTLTVDGKTYTRTLVDGTYYYKCSTEVDGVEVDPLWYDVLNASAKIQYKSLKWKLISNVKNRYYYSSDLGNTTKQITIANLNASNDVVVNSSALYGESFSLIGYVDFETGNDMAIINEKYIVSKLYESVEFEQVLDATNASGYMSGSIGNHTCSKPFSDIIKDAYNSDSVYLSSTNFSYNIKGTTSQGNYTYSELVWELGTGTDSNISITTIDKEKYLVINNWENIQNSTYLYSGSTTPADYCFTITGKTTVSPTGTNGLSSATTFNVITITIIINNGKGYPTT